MDRVGFTEDLYCNECLLWVQWEDWDEEMEQCRWCAEDDSKDDYEW